MAGLSGWARVIHTIIHAECVGGDIDLLANQRATIGFFPWRFVDGESSIRRCVAFMDDGEYEALMARKAQLPKTRFGGAYDPALDSTQRTELTAHNVDIASGL
jgi:hypothetical protein